MKKIILILALIVSFVSCNKSSNSSLAPASNTTTTQPSVNQVFCVYKIVNGAYIFYICKPTQDEANNEVIKLRDAGEYGTVSKKSNCNQC